jgi:RNA polymerase sigma-70 factor, ECF subfamily
LTLAFYPNDPSMHTTNVSLLERLRDPDNQSGWARFVELYTPLLCSWGRRAGLQEPDVADLVQDVFQVLLRRLPEFHYDRAGTFRGWLRTVLINQVRTRLRRRVEHPLNGEEPASPDAPDEWMEKEYSDYLVARALHIMKTDFQPATWQACWQHVVCSRTAADVAEEVGLSVKAVYSAKARVLQRLRQELEGLW